MSDIINNIVEWAEEAVIPFKELIQDNYSNPIMWIVFLATGIFLFSFTYETLNKG